MYKTSNTEGSKALNLRKFLWNDKKFLQFGKPAKRWSSNNFLVKRYYLYTRKRLNQNLIDRNPKWNFKTIFCLNLAKFSMRVQSLPFNFNFQHFVNFWYHNHCIYENNSPKFTPINEKWLFILLAAFNSIFIKISLFSNYIKQLTENSRKRFRFIDKNEWYPFNFVYTM